MLIKNHSKTSSTMGEKSDVTNKKHLRVIDYYLKYIQLQVTLLGTPDHLRVNGNI